MTTLSLTAGPNTVLDRFAKLNWGIITILIALAFVGVLMHFSVSSGAWTDMPLTHGIRFAVLLVVMVLAAIFLDTRFWIAINSARRSSASAGSTRSSRSNAAVPSSCE